MANIVQSHDLVVPQNLRKLLAVAVKSIQWSYAIFWSLSLEEQGENPLMMSIDGKNLRLVILQWSDGYYNGDIKTRKTMQDMDVEADKTGLLRSDKLRELYKSLLNGEADQPNRRPTASLSPEDLTDAEWYYLVCMSFVFNPGQSLPGRALANGETIWLCNAQYAENKVFSRSLLAKSASIQTVVCFPHFGGVIELGTTDLVAEDLSLIQHIKASLLDFSKPSCSSDLASPTSHCEDDGRDPVCEILNHEMVDATALELHNLYSPTEHASYGKEESDKLYGSMQEDFKMDSFDDCSSGCEHTIRTKDSLMLEGLHDGVSLVQGCQFLDNELEKGVGESINPSDCMSQAFLLFKELEEGNDTKLSSSDLGGNEDLQYIRTVSYIMKVSNQMNSGSKIVGGYGSSFVCWQKGGGGSCGSGLQQKILKKILFVVPSMHTRNSVRSKKENAGQDQMHKLKTDEEASEEYISPNDNFQSIPFIHKLDEELVKYLKDLEARVEELESCTDWTYNELRPRKNSMDMVEQISDNYELKSKRIVELNEVHELSSDVKVSVKGKEVQIEMKCPYREYILLDIMDEINKLYLDAHCVRSSTIDGILNLTLESKFQGSAIAPVGMVKQALLKVAGKKS